MHYRHLLSEAYRGVTYYNRWDPDFVSPHEIELEIVPQKVFTNARLGIGTNYMSERMDGQNGAKVFVGGKITISQELLDRFEGNEFALKAYFFKIIAAKTNIESEAAAKATGVMSGILAISTFIVSHSDIASEISALHKIATVPMFASALFSLGIALLAYAVAEPLSKKGAENDINCRAAKYFTPKGAIDSLAIENNYLNECNPGSEHRNNLIYNRRKQDIADLFSINLPR